MKILMLLICQLPCLCCAVAGAVLCFHQVDGWGWFLFVALLLHTVPRFSKESGKESASIQEL